VLSFTTWLLPWLTLTAQLPYEGSHWRANLLALLLSLGSPTILIMSLTMTVTNGNWIHKKFRILWKRSQRFRAQPSPMHERFDQRINAASLIVQECQQAPMRASEDDGWLSSLIVLKENQSWWIYVEGHIRHTRKGVTLSLVAQISMAFIAWLFTIAVALVGNLGDSTTALQLASGSLWLWMIPATHGWITGNPTLSIQDLRRLLIPSHSWDAAKR
jgi:hypothetical protein